MANVDYPDKSDAKKREEKKGEVAPVALKGPVTEKKRNKIKDAFISEDIVDVKDYVFMDVFIPALKKLIVDIFTNGINALFYGNSAKGSTSSSITYLTPYDKISSSTSKMVAYRTNRSTIYDYKNVVFSNEGDARIVLDKLDEIVERYGVASVADLYQLVRRPTTSTDFDWGWSDLRLARVVYDKGNWIINFPKINPINK